jgi:hypothetical protein
MRYSLQIGLEEVDNGKSQIARPREWQICVENMSLYHFSCELRLVSKNAKFGSDYLSVKRVHFTFMGG